MTKERIVSLLGYLFFPDRHQGKSKIAWQAWCGERQAQALYLNTVQVILRTFADKGIRYEISAGFDNLMGTIESDMRQAQTDLLLEFKNRLQADLEAVNALIVQNRNETS